MIVASLFSGAGGFELGLKGSDRLILLNDNDPHAQAVLGSRFPGTKLVPDVADVSADDIAGADMLLGGFPCQDVSIVGGQRGLAGGRTALVRHVFRLADRARPERILLENVQSIRFVHAGRVLAFVVSEAERLGYAWAYRVLDSRAFGLPQRRRRLYFLASRVDDPRNALLADAGTALLKEPIDPAVPIGFYWTEGRAGHGLTGNGLPPLKSGSALGIASPPAVLMPDGTVRVPTIATAERLQGFPPGWTASAPQRWRWKLVGNAVSVPVIGWIRSAIDRPAEWAERPTEPIPDAGTWPNAAWGDGRGRRWTATAGEAPTAATIGKLTDERYDWTDLSERALTGFIRRARDSRLKYPPGFLARLEARVPGS